MKYAVINQYGITLRAGRHDDSGYAYIPRSEGKASYEACQRWIKRNDSANTCSIVEMDAESEGKK
jgi:hypothetical protein